MQDLKLNATSNLLEQSMSPYHAGENSRNYTHSHKHTHTHKESKKAQSSYKIFKKTLTKKNFTLFMTI